jgi:hypothetical protein
MAGSYDWPLDHDAYLLNAKDVVTRLRNHPSLIMFGGGNELLPIPVNSRLNDLESDTSPPRDIDEGLRSFVTDLDGSRIYISSSVTDVGSEFDPSSSLGPKDGPVKFCIDFACLNSRLTILTFKYIIVFTTFHLSSMAY